MQDARVYLGLVQERGKKRLPLKRVYRQLYNRDLYLIAYGKIYRNAGAMTQGTTEETVDTMSLAKIDAIINALRQERYHWKPVRRVYIVRFVLSKRLIRTGERGQVDSRLEQLHAQVGAEIEFPTPTLEVNKRKPYPHLHE